jgi:multidrug efflux system membrane fusion protein
VYLVKADNTVAVQQITVLTGNDTVTAVTGVNPGVNIATSGFDRLESGAKVSVGQPGGKGKSGKSAGGPGSTSTSSKSGGSTAP